jgi:hypothetical protein
MSRLERAQGPSFHCVSGVENRCKTLTFIDGLGDYVSVNLHVVTRATASSTCFYLPKEVPMEVRYNKVMVCVGVHGVVSRDGAALRALGSAGPHRKYQFLH